MPSILPDGGAILTLSRGEAVGMYSCRTLVADGQVAAEVMDAGWLNACAPRFVHPFLLKRIDGGKSVRVTSGVAPCDEVGRPRRRDGARRGALGTGAIRPRGVPSGALGLADQGQPARSGKPSMLNTVTS